MTTAEINALTTDQAPVLSTAAIAALTAAQVQALPTADIAKLTVTQVQALTATEMAALTTAQVQALATDRVAALKATQVAAMTTDGIHALTTDQAPALSTAAIAALSTAQIQALTTADTAQFTTAQIAALTCVEQRALSSAQLTSFSTTQLNALQLGTPLVLDLSGDGIQTTTVQSGVAFDLNATGQKLSTGWLSPRNGFLVVDLNGDGIISDGSELFGSGTRLPTGERAADGFAALRVFDTNHDGAIDSRDARFRDVAVWVDANQDAVCQPGEMHTLASLGIVKLNLDAKDVSIENNGNVVGMLSSYETADGKSHTLADVWFRIKNAQDHLIDLAAMNAASAAPGSFSKVDLTNNNGSDQLIVNAAAILAFGATPVAGSGRPVPSVQVAGDAGDTVTIEDERAQWTDAGLAPVDGVEYHVYLHGSACLLVGVDLRVVFENQSV
jgi:hypothetical protein